MKALSYIFLFVMIIRPIFPVMDYVVNYEYIATELCENRSQPELNCNGKCHLKKEMAKASENDVPSSEKKNFKVEIPLLFLEAITSFDFSNPVMPEMENDSCYCNLYSHMNAFMVFHPPIS